MPSLTYNGQSFSIDGRRLWILGASIEYARVPAALWASRIAAAKQAGFNTIETGCPWMVHEPRKGRMVFDGDANIRQFIQLCGKAGMRVILRPGPSIGSQFDGGGLPGWLIETPEIRLRENNTLFLEHVSRYFRRLLGEVSDLQVTSSPAGPILLVQSEHAWTCANETQAGSYLNEITRFIRESGITVPIINSNDLWQDTPGTIDTWRGYDELLVQVRQLRTVQPTAPRLVSEFEAAEVQTWGPKSQGARSKRRASEGVAQKSPEEVVRRLAEVLATGAQPIVTPFHAGTNWGFLGGRIPIASDGGGFVTTAGFADPPLGQAGTRGRKYHAIRRLITFANHFSHVFAELEPEYQPTVLDPETEAGSGKSQISVVALRGSQGRIVFVFGEESKQRLTGSGPTPAATLALDDGIRLPVHLGDQSVGWFALDVDLHGAGRLDYSNICPWAVVDRSIVIFQGPAKASVFLSIGGTPLEVAVPGSGDHKPLVVPHKGLTIVICNHEQIDATYHDDKTVYVGVSGFDANGNPLPHDQFPKASVVRHNTKVELKDTRAAGNAVAGTAKNKQQLIPLVGWQVASGAAHVSGESPRYASLEGPESLSECGAPWGYGWYRVNLSGSGRKLCHIPHGGDRLHLFVDGARRHLFGAGPAADAGPFDLQLGSGRGGGGSVLVALADNLGRFSSGNDLSRPTGLWGHVYEVKKLRSIKAKVQTANPASPFSLRGFISGLDASQSSDSEQAVWKFSHTRKTPIILDIDGARCSGTFVLNDVPIAYYAGETGGCSDRILLGAQNEDSFKRGKNVLRFAPDAKHGSTGAAQEMAKIAKFYECVDSLTKSADGWAYAKWEPPPAASYAVPPKSKSKDARGVPCWWRAKFDAPNAAADDSTAYWLDTTGMSKGQAFLNGQNLGRYFTATGQGKPVGPQVRLYIPEPWLKPGHANEIILFDEYGFDPARVRLVRGPEEMAGS